MFLSNLQNNDLNFILLFETQLEIRKHLSKLQTRGRFSFRAIMLRTICDYISGMTDRRAISEYQNLYGIHN